MVPIPREVPWEEVRTHGFTLAEAGELEDAPREAQTEGRGNGEMLAPREQRLGLQG